MEKKIVLVDNYIQVKDGQREIICWVAEDGKEFSGFRAELDCKEYDNELKKYRFFSKIEKKVVFPDISSLEIADAWYIAKDEEELEAIKNYLGYNNTYDCVSVDEISKRDGSKMFVGEWYSSLYVDGGDYPGYQNIYSLSYVKEHIMKFLNSFER